jgi:hypothetical protein
VIDALAFPLFADIPRYTLDVTLDGTVFHLLFDWNGREDRWYLSVYESDGKTPVLLSRKIVPYLPVFLRCKNANRPKGELFFYGVTSAPGFAAMGRTLKMGYQPADV